MSLLQLEAPQNWQTPLSGSLLPSTMVAPLLQSHITTRTVPGLNCTCAAKGLLRPRSFGHRPFALSSPQLLAGEALVPSAATQVKGTLDHTPLPPVLHTTAPVVADPLAAM